MKNRTPLLFALALAVLFAPLALVAQESAEATQEATGCLQMNAEGDGFVLVDESGEVAVEGAEDELKAATGNTVTITGTQAADAEGNTLLQAESIENSDQACAEGEEEHPEGEEEHPEGEEEEHPEGEDEHPGA